MSNPKAIIILLDSNRGQYIPLNFVNEINLSAFKDLPADIEPLYNPDHDSYWETWERVIDNATHTDSAGNLYRLYHDGDLFLVCDKLMSDEEYSDFYGEERS